MMIVLVVIVARIMMIVELALVTEMVIMMTIVSVALACGSGL